MSRSLQAGTIELRSGAWSWSARPAATGTTVVFHHLQRGRDEMRAWTLSAAPREEEILALARDPVTRSWCDSIGLQWSVSMERMSTRDRSRYAGPDDASELRWLLFQRGGVPRQALVTADTHLGELTRAELQELSDATILRWQER